MAAKKRARKRKTKRDTPAEQSARFIATGKTLGADKDSEAVGRLLKKVAPAHRKPAP
jgi:hypothetical protein